MKLVILESPTKTKTLSRYLAKDYLILSSNGHIKKLAKTGKHSLGIDLQTFQPTFILDSDKQNTLLNLTKSAQKAKIIYLATDPDREGEAISAHLSEYIQSKLPKMPPIQRVVFNEITKTAVLNGFANPTTIDHNLVESQITRRLLDRMVGFRLTDLLRKKIKAKSAGRVQSVALKLLVERQKEIDHFQPTKTWDLFATFDKVFIAQLCKEKITTETTSKWQKVVISDERTVLNIKKQLHSEFVVETILIKEQILSPPKPLKTSTLLQLASSKLNFSVKKTMFLAQQLYEGVEIDGQFLGLITYPRSDSERISSLFFDKVSAFIKKQYGKQFQTPKTVHKKVKQTQFSVQDAHESIHITDDFIDLATAKRTLSPDLYRLYSLIYHYSIAPLMAPARLKNIKFHLLNNNYLFELICEELVFPGYLQFLHPHHLKDFTDLRPGWKTQQIVTAQKVTVKAKISKPKPRFTEGTLIKTLEKIGVGRPSTYNTIVEKLLTSFYIDKTENKLIPTGIGKLVSEKLTTFFPDLINEKYTCNLEEKLDRIAEGKFQRMEFFAQFWPFLQKKLDYAQTNMMEEKGIKVNKSCPECSNDLVQKQGRYGSFISCSNYPECTYIQREQKPLNKVGRNCPNCQKDLVQKQGRYGKFISCSGYPECKYIENKAKLPGVKIGRACTNCKKDLVEKQGRYGVFISCSGYPECKYIEKTQPTSVKIGRLCTHCNSDLVEKQGRYGTFISCSGYPKCRYIEQKK